MAVTAWGCGTRPIGPLPRPNIGVRGLRQGARAPLTVAVILCGSIVALSFWSSGAAPAPGPAERGARRRQASPPPSYQKLRVNLDLQAGLRGSPASLSRDP